MSNNQSGSKSSIQDEPLTLTNVESSILTSQPSTSIIQELQIVQDVDNDTPYKVLSSTVTQSKKFNTQITELTIKVKPIIEKPEEKLRDIFDLILKKELKDIPDRDRVGIVLDNTTYNKPLYISLRPHHQICTDIILAEIERVVQSNENFFLNEPLNLKLTTVHLPNGQALDHNLNLLDLKDFCMEKSKSIVRIINNDNLCLLRAVVVGIANIDRKTKKITGVEYKKLIRSDRDNKLQRDEAVKLCQDVGFDMATFRGNLEDLDKIQKHLASYEITLFDGVNKKGKIILYKGNTDNTNYIDLLLVNNHYNTITSVIGAFTYRYYCRGCNVGYSNKGAHRCKNACKSCKSSIPCEIQPTYSRKCNDCNMYFKNLQCFVNHTLPTQENNQSVCDVIKYCYRCKLIFRLNPKKFPEHICGNKICRNCKKYVDKEHLCHIQKKSLQPQTELTEYLYVFFDFESRISFDKKHIPNYCVVQHQCTRCLTENQNIEQKCPHCDIREYFIEGKEGNDLIESFFNIVTSKSRFFRKVYVFAHNGGGYDFQFLANYMITVQQWDLNIIKNGSKIICMDYRNISFKDTLNFFGCKLASLPKMFDIVDSVKGYFPHFFNKPENVSYKGILPGMEYYGPDYMTFEERKKFMAWYTENQNQNFDFKEEMRKYCRSDVNILRKAALKFRDLFIQLLNLDPLIQSATIASACMTGYRNNFMPENMIGVMDFKSYRMRNNQSKMALKYLLYLERKMGIQLQSAYRGWEKTFGNYSVDGYCANVSATKLGNTNIRDRRKLIPFIVEVHGCIFHGCPTCYPKEQQRLAPILTNQKGKIADTLQRRYENTVKKIQFLQKLKERPAILEIWECEIGQRCTVDEGLRKIMDGEDLIMIESNREAFFGGRTECFQKRYEVKEGEQIRYIDVNSLYPFVNKYGIYPTSHPEVFINDEAQQCQLQNITGIAKVKILPPKQLIFPVLPIRANNKLMFALCQTCAEIGNNEQCTHSEEEREILGTFTTIEISEAIKRGYQIQKIYEVWSYLPTQFDKTTGTGGIFANYINKFLKIKQAASGYPKYVKSENDKILFCEKFLEKEGIILQPSEVILNPGLRSLSKLCLNSLWGKFGQRNCLTQTTIITTPEKYYSLILDPEKEISDISILKSRPINEKGDILLVSWQTRKECTVDKDFANPIVCAFVTAQARLYLLNFLEKLGDRVLYCDTDSIIYIHRAGDNEIETGPYLGEMGNELDTYGSGCYISEFVCALQKRVDYLEQDSWEAFKQIESLNNYTRKDNVIFTGIPVSENENAYEVAIHAAKIAGLNISHKDIVDCHRLPGRGKGSPTFVVKFVNRELKKRVIDGFRENKPMADCFGGDKKTKVFANEHLAPHTARLFREARKLKPLFQSVRYSNGNIIVQKDRESAPIRIESIAQIGNLKGARSVTDSSR